MDGLNLLTWFLYLADVLQNFSVVLGCIVWIGIASIGLPTFFRLAASESLDSAGHMIKRLPTKRILTVILISALLAAAIHTKDTMYLMAASELGEEAINTELADDIKEYISRMLGEPVQ